MRIISGARRGLQLQAPKGDSTRPTEDRIKENMFNLLGPFRQNTIALDCFAGSGALGLEAVSRGAASGIFFEKNRQAYRVLNRNIEKARWNDRCHTYCEDAVSGLSRWSGEAFDYVFLDPPYRREDLYSRVLKVLAERNLLSKDGIIVIERKANCRIFRPSEFTEVKEKRYRDTVIEIWRKK